jgi:hypothetical protein
MLYDLASAPPERGSLLESLFLVLSKRRQEQEFLKTRVLAEAMLAPHIEGKGRLTETFDDYANAMFPYLQSEKEKKEKLAADALKQWTDQKVLKVRPLWRAKEGARGLKSRLALGAERVKNAEEARRTGKLRRI